MATDAGFLYGDWRRRRGTKTDAHLYNTGARRPLCGRVIERHGTDSVASGRPCYECLASSFTFAPRS